MNPSYLRWLRWSLLGLGGTFLGIVFAVACTFVYLAPSLPTPENMRSVEMAVPLRVYARSGGLISQIGEQRRIPITFDDIPPVVRQAVLAAEDDRFFEHHGLDWMGLTRALLMNVVKGYGSQGGSTITQQTVKYMFLTKDKSLRRKARELFITYRMERDFTKEQILAAYLNVIPYGQRSYGIAAAAETYYGKKPTELTVAEAATLAGIVQRPSDQNPVSDPKAAAGRRAYVLRRMQELGYIDDATATAAAKEPVVSRSFAPLVDVEAPYVAELARQEIVTRFGKEAVNAGYKVFTTIDDRLQVSANRAVRIGLMEYDRRHGYRGKLGKVTLPAAPTDSDLEQLLEKFDSISLLQPAVVVQVSGTSADIHIRYAGRARIAWDGLSWARPASKNGTLGAAPRKASDVLTAGDVIYVVTDRRGTAQLAQLPQAQSALVALDPGDGAIVSLVGGFDFHQSALNRVTQARRQPGSGFKPILYSAALDNGFTPASVILDTPVLVERGDSEENWRPENSGGEFSGPMRLREALVRSRNLVSIRILQGMGVEAAMDHAAKFGFPKESLPRNLTLALGTLSATPLQMATGYAVFANGGFKIEPYYISRIENSAGEVVFEATPKIACTECEQAPVPLPSAPDVVAADATIDTTGAAAPPVTAFTPSPRDIAAPAPLQQLARVQGGSGYISPKQLAPRVLSPQNAWLMTDIMHDVAMRGTAIRTRALGRDDLSGKTGTSQDNRDNWFNGYNGRLVASVWVGFDAEKSLGGSEEGSSTAVPIWIHYMREALRDLPSHTLERPGGLVDLKVSPVTGELADPLDPNAIHETFMVQSQPVLPDGVTPGAVPGAGPAAGAGSGATGGTEPIF